MVYKQREPKPTDAPVFSHSQLKDANLCMKMWEYKYRKNKIVAPNERFRLGSANHAYLERLYKIVIRDHGGKSRPLTDSQTDELFDPAYLEEAEIALIDSLKARTYIAYYLKVYSELDKYYVFLDAENQLFVPFITPKGRKIYFEVIIDLVAFDERDHQLVIIDHKTGGKTWSYDQALFDIQLPIYMAAQRLIGRPVGRAVINFVRTGMAKPQTAFLEGSLFTRLEVKKSNREIDGTLHQLGRRIDRILEDVENDEITFSLGQNCPRCPYREVCKLHLAQQHQAAEVYLQNNYLDKERPVFTSFVPQIRQEPEVKPQEEELIQELKFELENLDQPLLMQEDSNRGAVLAEGPQEALEEWVF